MGDEGHTPFGVNVRRHDSVGHGFDVGVSAVNAATMGCVLVSCFR